MSTVNLRLIAITPPVSGAKAPTESIEPTNWSSADVRAELHRVLASRQFDTSERNRRFLEYVVEETLAGRGNRIKAYSIATVVFGRDVNFDPQLDPVVRMEARRLRRSLERFYLTDDHNEVVRITIPKGGYVPEFENALNSRLATTAVRHDVPDKLPQLGPSIAVTEFEAEGDESIFLNYHRGFTRQLMVGLSRFPELCVFAPSMVAGHGDRDSRPPKELDVDLILTGTSAVFADVLNVKSTLLDAQTGKVIWGQTFEQDLKSRGILRARDDIANRIVRALAQTYGVILSNDGNSASTTCNESLTRFYRYRRSYRHDLFRSARESLEREVRSNPASAEAWACLSQIYTDGHRFGFAAEAPARLQHQAAAFAERALELAPDSSRGHHAQGLASWFLQDARVSVDALLTALSLNPNATEVMADLGLHWSLLGEWEHGIPLLEDVYAQNPAQLGCGHVALSLFHFENGRFEQAFAEAKKVCTPELTCGFVAQAISLARLGRLKEAADAVACIVNIDPQYDRGVLFDVGGGNVEVHLAAQVEQALREAGLPRTVVRRRSPQDRRPRNLGRRLRPQA